MTLNGTIFTLTSGRYEATIATAGATLCSLTCDGRDLVVPFDPRTSIGSGFQGRTLVPWPNRTTEARYSFDGVVYELPINEPTTGAANHGLALWSPWEVAEVTSTSVQLILDLPGSPGYPFDIVVQATFELSESGLIVSVEGENSGATAAPFGAGYHPYLTCAGRSIDECSVLVPAATVLLVDDKSAPSALIDVTEAGLDLRTETPLAGRNIDNAFTALSVERGRESWTVSLTHPDSPAVHLTSAAPWIQLYTGELLNRAGLAVEPMTCGVDAFNEASQSVALEPGQRRILTFQISSA